MGRLIGVLGGSFDPPHITHLILAAEAHYQLGLERVAWVLTPDNPLKEGQSVAPLDERADMLRAAIAGNPAFVFSRVDIDRDPPYYAYQTVQILQAQNPGAGLVYLVGGDSLRDLPRWERPQALLAACRFLGVMDRPGASYDLENLESQLPGLAEKVRRVDVPLINISSTYIRQRAALGAPVAYYLPQPVYEIIRDRRLYAAKGLL